MIFRGILPPWVALDVLRGIALAILLSAVSIIVLGAIVRATGQGSGFLTRTLLFGLPVGMLILALQEGVFVLAAWWYSVRKYAAPRDTLGFVKPEGTVPYLMAIGAWLIALVTISLWSRLIDILGWQGLKAGGNAHEVLGLGGSFVVSLVVVAVWGPFTEEIFFRGFCLAGLRRRLGDRGALVVSAARFGVLDPLFQRLRV